MYSIVLALTGAYSASRTGVSNGCCDMALEHLREELLGAVEGGRAAQQHRAPCSRHQGHCQLGALRLQAGAALCMCAGVMHVQPGVM